MKVAESLQQYKMRPMRMRDIDEVHTLERNIFPAPWSLRSYHYEVERNSASKPCVIEAVDELGRSSIAAYIVTWRFFDEVHIANIAVAPQFRRLGLGKRLVKHMLANAAQDGAKIATLEVRAGNVAAIELYQGLGFEVVGRRAGYYRDNGEDAILMRLSIIVVGEGERSPEVF